MNSRSNKIWNEPLIHFLVIGALVFGIHAWLGNIRADADRTISISAAQIQRLSAIWTSETGREPTVQEVEGLLADHVREEVLYREALRLGLDRDDTIIRRRLAQKIGFIIARDETLPPLGEAELRTAFESDPTVYARPDRLSLVHVPYNFARDGRDRSEDIARDLEILKSSPDSLSLAPDLGDPFLLAREHALLSKTELSRLFGRDFAESLFAEKEGEWRGPVRSRLADHLVLIRSKVPGGIPDFDDVRDDVRVRENDLQKRRADEEAWQKLRERYVIKINDGA